VNTEEPDDLRLLRALADPARFDIVRRLAAGEELTSSVLERTMELSKSTISHHLRLLTDVGLVRLTRRGRVQVLSLDPQTLSGLGARLSALGRPDPSTDRLECRGVELEQLTW
jgi:DNA-binding transcriptional ArsR family regulator